MTHDEHLAALADEFHHGIGSNTGTNLAGTVGLLGAATVEGEIITVLHNRLVTATAKGHFHRQRRKIVALFKGSAIDTHTDRQGGFQTGGIFHPVHFLQDGEFILHNPV